MTPTGTRKVAAMMCMPELLRISLRCRARPFEVKSTYTAAITAAAPSSMLALAKILLTRQRIMNRTWASRPGQLGPGSTQHRDALTITDADQLQRGMGFGDLSLAGDAQQGKEDNHGTAARGEPEGPSNAIVIAGEGRAE